MDQRVQRRDGAAEAGGPGDREVVVADIEARSGRVTHPAVGGEAAVTDDAFAVEVGAVLRDVRKARGLSLRQVTVRSRGEFKPSSIASYERGERQISVVRLFALADVYDVAPERVVAAIAHRLERSTTGAEPDVQVIEPFAITDARRH